MNIFLFDADPVKNAQYHGNRHVVKMMTEYCQILSTTCHYFGAGTEDMYRQTHTNHPCCVWVRESRQNFEYLLNLAIELLNEYTHRYGKIAKSAALIPAFIDAIDSIPLGENKLTPFVAVLPNKVVLRNIPNEQIIEAYRALYRNEKAHIAVWKLRDIPNWL